MAADRSPSEWEPHAEKQFGLFTHTLSKHLPQKMTQLRRVGVAISALPGANTRRKTR